MSAISQPDEKNPNEPDKADLITLFRRLASSHLTLFVARTRRPFLTRPFPAPVLLWSAIGTKILVTLFATSGFGRVTPISWTNIGIVWMYCLVWIFIEDWAKLHVYHHLELSGKRHRKFLELIQQPLHPHKI